MFLIVATALFAAFFANVLAGAYWRLTVLSDVQEMLLLLLACLFFVAACLRARRRDLERVRAGAQSQEYQPERPQTGVTEAR